ncbi:hypothetical protein HK100_004782, partial [Physocladia obscura]
MRQERQKRVVGELRNRVRGLLVGAALGDAFGLSCEFLSKAEAVMAYGRNGPIAFGAAYGAAFVRDRHRRRWQEGDFTDDTDQQLLLVHSLLATVSRNVVSSRVSENNMSDNVSDNMSDSKIKNSTIIKDSFNTNSTKSNNKELVLDAVDFAGRLKSWSRVGFVPLAKPPNGIGATISHVLRHRDFDAHPHEAAFSVWQATNFRLAANGAVMRCAILGAPYFWHQETVVRNAVVSASVTHADPRCLVSCAIVCTIVSRILRANLNLDDYNSAEPLLSAGSTLFSNNSESSLEAATAVEAGLSSSCSSFSDESVVSARASLESGSNRDSAEISVTTYNSYLEKLGGQNPLCAALICDATLENAYILDVYKIPEIPAIASTTEATSGGKSAAKTSTSGHKATTTPPATPKQDFITDLDILKAFVSAESLGSLMLDEFDAIGYTYKCLGAALFCFSRNLSPKLLTHSEQESMQRHNNDYKGELFKRIITELTLEAGDSDTNAAVAGALLGVRIGYDSLPKDWLQGLRHHEYLVQQVDALCD